MLDVVGKDEHPSSQCPTCGGENNSGSSFPFADRLTGLGGIFKGFRSFGATLLNTLPAHPWRALGKQCRWSESSHALLPLIMDEKP